MTWLRVLAGVAGVGLVLGTLLSAIRTVVVPRAESVGLTRAVFAGTRALFDALTRLRPTWAWTDRVMSLYAPVTLISLPLVWLTHVFVGFGLLFWAVGTGGLGHAMEVAGSSLLTLGFTKPGTPAGIALAFVGASLVLAVVVLLLVSYLPVMYNAFAARERLVVLLESRAGAPPSGVEFLERMGVIHGLDQLDLVWDRWEQWFAHVQESHTTHPALPFFRSQRSDQSWLTAAGALLDAASLYVACVDHAAVVEEERRPIEIPTLGDRPGRQQVWVPQAELCIRAGYLCLRDIATFFRIPFDPDPAPDDPVAVTREEFDAAMGQLEEAGVPLIADRDAAWAAFAGWRVNYESALLGLANLIAAPEAPWVSDRSPVLAGTGPA